MVTAYNAQGKFTACSQSVHDNSGVIDTGYRSQYIDLDNQQSTHLVSKRLSHKLQHML